MTTKIGIYYGSQTGTTDGIAKLIAQQFQASGFATNTECVSRITPEQLTTCDVLLLGTSTWDIGELPYDWQKWWSNFDQLDLTGKSVALFGLGDQFGYPDTFCDAMRYLYDKVIERGGTITGYWPVDGYTFDASTAVFDGYFVGLAIDEVNQSDLTVERIEAWCNQLIGVLSLDSQYSGVATA